jgi:N6-adenosine-specific RNA methylase IME4
MTDPVIYRNSSGTVFLLDLPTSIQDGQKSLHTLRSPKALESPYPSTEPRGAKRDAAIALIPASERVYHDSLQKDISMALSEIQDHLRGLDQDTCWCYPRSHVAPERALDFSTEAVSAGIPVILSTTENCNKFSTLHDLAGSMVCNLLTGTAEIVVTGVGCFSIPPRSTFTLASLEQGLQSLYENVFSTRPGLDLILMDPPWSNRSVRHSGAYKTQETQKGDPFEEALRIVEKLLSPEGWAAVWVTNKSSIRAKVFDAFRSLGFQLHEEWVWIKTTTHGKPVTQLDGLWRLPYEVVLLFRKGPASETVKRRVIAAVPDLHSRKPCLKVILDEMLPTGYRALELFARSLTAGWWSWGDEVLRFQHESHWVSPPGISEFQA